METYTNVLPPRPSAASTPSPSPKWSACPTTPKKTPSAATSCCSHAYHASSPSIKFDDSCGGWTLDDLETEFPGQFSMPIPRGRWDMNRKFVEQVATNASAYIEHIEFVPEDTGNL